MANAFYGPNMTALIQTAVARGWVDWRGTQDQLWKRVEIETATLYCATPGEVEAAAALYRIWKVDLLMLGLA